MEIDKFIEREKDKKERKKESDLIVEIDKFIERKKEG